MNTYYLRRLRNGNEWQKRRVLYKLGLRRLAIQMWRKSFDTGKMSDAEYMQFISAAQQCERQAMLL